MSWPTLRSRAATPSTSRSSCPKVSIDDRYRDTPYYLAPEDKVGQEAFAVIRDAMKKKKMVGIARVVMARRERVMMLEAVRQGHHGHHAALPL